MSGDNKSMSIHEFASAASLILVEQANAKFTGQVTFEVSIKEGGICSVNAMSRGPMRVRDSQPAQRVPHHD